MNLIPRNFLFDDDLEDFFVTKPSKRGEMKCDIYEKDDKYYIGKICDLLNELPVIEGFNFKNLIYEYVADYYKFINIINNFQL